VPAASLERVTDTGRFIVFEGGEGSGKTTQIGLLAERLRPRRPVRITYEPGATPAGQRIRDLVLHNTEALSARAETLLFAADRAHHVATVVRPALAAGEWVISDRYLDSSVAYQGVGREQAVEDVRRISQWATDGLLPDLTVLLDVPAEVGLRRVDDRGAADKLEAESLDFHERVRRAFLQLAAAEPDRYAVLDATRPIDELAGQVWAAVATMLDASTMRDDRPTR
jgi:dTMP kinase